MAADPWTQAVNCETPKEMFCFLDNMQTAPEKLVPK